MDIMDFIKEALGEILYGGWETFDFTEADDRYYCAFKENKFEFKKGGENKMSTTESLVNYLYQAKRLLERDNQTLQTEPIREIVEALRRGAKNRDYQKHAEMWYDLRALIKSGNVYTLLPGDFVDKSIPITVIVKAFEEIEKRHLEKPKNKFIKIAKQLDKDVRELLKMLEEKMGD